MLHRTVGTTCFLTITSKTSTVIMAAGKALALNVKARSQQLFSSTPHLFLPASGGATPSPSTPRTCQAVRVDPDCA